MDTVLYLLAALCFLAGGAMLCVRQTFEMALVAAGLFLWVLVQLLISMHVNLGR